MSAKKFDITITLDADQIAAIVAALGVAAPATEQVAPKAPAKKAAAKKAAPKPEPTPEPEAADEDGDDIVLDEDALDAMSIRELRKVAKEAGVDTKGLDKDALIDLLLDLADEEAEGDDDEDDALDEDDLRAMSIGDIRKLAKSYGVKYKRGDSVDDIVDAMLEVAEEVEDDE